MNCEIEKDFFLEDCKYDDAKNNWITVGNSRYDPERYTEIFGKDDKFFIGEITDSGVKAIIRKSEKNYETEELHLHDKKVTNYFERKGNTFVLKIHSVKHEDNYNFFIYEFYEFTLSHFCLSNDVPNQEEIFKSLLMDLIEGLSLAHSLNVAIKNLSPYKVVICKENKKFKSKIFDLSQAIHLKDSEMAAKEIAREVIDVGILLLSLFFLQKDVQNILDNLQKKKLYHDKIDYVSEKLKSVGWIKSRTIKLFADLILCMIDVKLSNELKISDFKSHPFFWTEKEIVHFFNIINSRININADFKNKIVINNRIELLNSMMPKFDWRARLDRSVQIFTNNRSDWSELVRLIRNKNTHFDDDSDNEDTNNTENEDENKKKSKSLNKDPIAMRNLNIFFESKNGPFNYFLNTFSDLLFLLFDHFRLYKDHPKVKEFYPKCFLYEDPNQTLDGIDRTIGDSDISISPEEKSNECEKTTLFGSTVQNKSSPNVSAQSYNNEFRKIADKEKKSTENKKKKKNIKENKSSKTFKKK